MGILIPWIVDRKRKSYRRGAEDAEKNRVPGGQIGTVRRRNDPSSLEKGFKGDFQVVGRVRSQGLENWEVLTQKEGYC